MGNDSSNSRKSGSSARPPLQRQSTFNRIMNNYTSLEELKRDLRRKGLESSNLILGIDFTKSNEWTGKRTFRGRCLHDVSTPMMNPYEEVIDIVGKSLCEYDDDNVIPCYGFGDQSTGDHSVFSFMPLQNNGQPIVPGYLLPNIRQRYRELAPNSIMAGPTSFAPIILEAVNIVRRNQNAYHILVIVADGQVTRSVDVPDGQFSKQEKETIDAITYASNFPLSIVVVGVGDGPWDLMTLFDDALTQSRFDNFQFVDFDRVTRGARDVNQRETQFALNALMEIPEQYQTVRRLNLFQTNPQLRHPSYPMVMPPPAELPPMNYSYNPTNFAPSNNSQMMYPGPSSNSSSSFTAPSKQIPVYVPAPESAIPVAAPLAEALIPCPVCTYDNRASSTQCEVCATPLHSTNGNVAAAPTNIDQQLLSTVREMHEAQLCPICEDQKKNMVFQCGHETCASCGEQLSLCPICRLPIQAKIKRYV